ncbi:wax ester/triacylglycerol synthase family O-acyltransferase [Halovenus sp. WSH3]|uniref:Wax ester/triacylglycerol synthase family O-acyltransferase n=1 Tax=Halovenus carboxidivorans TaxID=2692199 RepID=A0A6B0T7D5_9EURY|nr:wax ester/triacylglycerol synthase family O-acyltransferase [Halovenus carboxidivorans]MXR52857.1 wax ester/triacylglycerol synthase family O-acyltransferase [Halovenus carboxidivorans]
MPEREPLSGADNAWRRMGETNNLMTITGILWFDDHVSYDEVCDRLEERLLQFDRFKQKVGGRKRRVRRPYWETVEEFDIDAHVYDISLPDPATDETFQTFIGRLMSRPLDERRPLWEAYLIDDVNEGEGNAITFRINHSLGDGFALLYVLLGLADNPEEIELPIGNVPSPPGEDESPTSADREGTASSETRAGSGNPNSDSGRSADESADLSEIRFGKAGLAATTIKEVDHLLRMPDEADTSLRGDLGTRKRASWTDEIDLDRIKAVKRHYDATVNDVLLAVTAGALRRELESRGEDTEGLQLRCTVPVNLVPMADRDEQLGNGFGIAFLPLPVGERDLGERIRFMNENVGVEKLGIEAYLMYRLIEFGGLLPESGQQKLMELFEDRATGIVTNVPGPLNTFEFAGTEVTDMVFWVPQAVDQGLGISLITYGGSVRIGVAGDANVLPDAGSLAEHFEAEIRMLEDELDAT